MKSKFRILGIASLIALFFVLGIIFTPYLLAIPPTQQGLYVFFFLLIITYLAYNLFKNLNKVDINNEVISFNNVFLKTEQAYRFSELDGFITQTKLTNGNVSDVIYLIKHDQEVQKIPSFYYANYQEIKRYLKARLQYLG
ncbi:hypothetical protein [Microscilla marina]|uniref:Uncharacterized protein n=1 Tax=Microscilla marina ATCC 23134 TaxID=313606 RepID=A1ZPW6_MICM2|nr:hypothetical protein [Microscilla marina]EAY27621.1 hypothetical protein M23134_02868 [Microscilla marina ATCC 23134]